MGDLESFSFLDQGPQGFNAEKLREFQARMAEAAKQLQAQQKREQKQKKKETELAKILLAFIQNSSQAQDELVGLIAQLLAYDLPASFILAILLISQPQLASQAGLLLSAPATATASSSTESNIQPTESSLLVLDEQNLRLDLKLKINQWLAALLNAAQENSEKIRRVGLMPNHQFKPAIIHAAALSLEKFLQNEEQYLAKGDLLRFCHQSFQVILKELQKNSPKALN